MNSYFHNKNAGVSFINTKDQTSIHTKKDLNLILENVDISYPTPKTDYVEVPYRDGKIDLTEVNGEEFIRYNNRTLTLNMVDTIYGDRFESEFSNLARYILGKYKKIILDRDPGFFYLGRILSISNPTKDINFGRASVTCDVDPFKYAIETSTEEWLWDPFSFEEGVINEGKNLTVNGNLSVWFDIGVKPLIPTITCSSAMTVTINGTRYSLNSGKNYNTDILLKPGKNTFIFSGNGTVTVDFRRCCF